MFIVLEGLDGAGKTTQIKKLQQLFEERGRLVNYLHFPRFEASLYGEMIGRFLRGEFGDNESVHPMLVALLFAEDRREAAPILREWLGRGEVILLDRYLFSNIAFQCAKVKSGEEEEMRNWIYNMEVNHNALPLPDHVLFLDVPLNFIGERLSRDRGGDDREYLKGKEDIHEADLSYQSRVRELYLKECDHYKSMSKIECSTPSGGPLEAEEVFEIIVDRLKL